MAGDKTALIGIYPTRTSLEAGVQALKDAGFPSADISVICPGNPSVENPVPATNNEATPEGAAPGATTGAVVGGVLGWLADVGSLAIPGMGPLVAAGPIVAANAGAGAVGMVGGVAGGLLGLGVPESEAQGYVARLKGGTALLSVHVQNSDASKRARKIMEETGAENISANRKDASRD
jgi:hypothetical protein